MQFKFDNSKVEKIITDTKVLQKKVGLEIGKGVLEYHDGKNEWIIP